MAVRDRVVQRYLEFRKYIIAYRIPRHSRSPGEERRTDFVTQRRNFIELETEAIEEEMLSNDTLMLEMDIKIQDLRTELSRKTKRSTKTTQIYQVEVPSPSPYYREPIHESSAHDN